MFLRLLLAVVHLLGLGVGLGAVWARARALGRATDAASLRPAFYADTWWGVAALLWIGTGLVRAFAGFEKGTAYYLGNHLFLTKMALLALILALEVWPMMTLIRWRQQAARGEAMDLRPAPRFARISVVQAVLVVLMVGCAVGMARGLGS